MSIGKAFVNVEGHAYQAPKYDELTVAAKAALEQMKFYPRRIDDVPGLRELIHAGFAQEDRLTGECWLTEGGKKMAVDYVL